MKISHPVLSLAILALIAVSFAAPTHSFADTFQIFNLGSDNGYHFYGMNDSGLVVIDNPGALFCAPATCYYSFLNGSSAGISTTAPIFTADNGTPCTPGVPSGGSILHGVCNNGRDAFTGRLTSGQVLPNVYFGPTFQDIFTPGSAGLIYMNNLGNIVFDDQIGENWYEAIDLTTATTPEPSSLLLLATGLIGLAAVARRRLISQS